MSAFQNGAMPVRAMDDDSDVEEEALVADYREQVQFEDGMEELEPVTSLSMAQQTDDIQSRLAAAAQPLDFSAPLEVKFQSYDSYCSLFHFILNSEGPVDLEPPSVSTTLVSISDPHGEDITDSVANSTTGPGTLSTNSSTSSTLSRHIEHALHGRPPMKKRSRSCARIQTRGAATAS
jgi:hypothetical protein